MKVKITIHGSIPKPKIGDSFGGYGLDGRHGYFEVPVKQVNRNYIRVGDFRKKVTMKEYAFHKLINKTRKKTNVLVFAD